MKKFLVVMLLLLLSACADKRFVPASMYYGESVITKLAPAKETVMSYIGVYSATTSGCNEPITRIDTTILEIPEKFTANDQGNINSGVIKERWDVTSCGKISHLYISLSFLPDGQTRFSLGTKP